MEAQRLTNLRRLYRAALGQHEALKQEAELERAQVRQRREALARVMAEHATMPETANESVAVLAHARRYRRWLKAEAQRLRLEMTRSQARVKELRASEVTAAQRARVLERLVERLELTQICRQRRAEQEFVDHVALRQSQGRPN